MRGVQTVTDTRDVPSLNRTVDPSRSNRDAARGRIAKPCLLVRMPDVRLDRRVGWPPDPAPSRPGSRKPHATGDVTGHILSDRLVPQVSIVAGLRQTNRG